MRTLPFILATITFLFSLYTSQAQVSQNPQIRQPELQSATSQTSSLANPNKRQYGGYYVGAGVRTFQVTPSTWSLIYVDHSPAQDWFSGSRELNAREYAPTIRLGVNWGKMRGKHVEIGGNFALGHSNYNALQLGLGLNLGKKWIFRPVVAGEFGFAGFKVGTLQNTSTYVQVHDSYFYDEQVNIKLVSWRANFTPRIDIGLISRKGTQVFASVGYSLNVLATGTSLQFRGENAEGDIIKATEGIGASNVSLYRNEAPANGKLPFDMDGYFASLTIGF